MTKPKLLLVEDHRLVGQGLASMLAAEYEIAGIVEDGAQAVESVGQHRPDVLLLDLSLPNRTGIDLLAEVHSAYPELRVLVITMHVESHLVEMAMKLGAAGFVPKNASLDELRTAIKEVLAGRRYLSPRLPKRGQGNGATEPMGFSRLTPQQQKIVRMIAQGLNSEQIAEALGLSSWTVHFHRKNIRKALGVQTDLEMYRYAILVGPNEKS